MAPTGKGIEESGATREGPLGTAVRDFSEVGGIEGRFWFEGPVGIEDLERDGGRGGAQGTRYESGGLTVLWDGVRRRGRVWVPEESP